MNNKTKISAKIVAHSKSISGGEDLISFVCVLPRIVLAELNTHNMFSKNSSSSRAIPFSKMLSVVEEDPFIPIAWQKQHKGMQGSEYFTESDGIENLVGGETICDIERLQDRWLIARNDAVKNAKYLDSMGLTKQISNRLLESFMWQTVICTTTESALKNFYNLRCPQYYQYVGKENDLRYKSREEAKKHWSSIKNGLSDYEKISEWSDTDWLSMNDGMAEIHISSLAEDMYDAYNNSTPKILESSEWHTPFGDDIDNTKLVEILKSKSEFSKDNFVKAKIKIATARCARVSYTTVGHPDKHNYENDFKLFDNLIKQNHNSPLQHCAKSMSTDEYNSYCRGKITDPNNFGWCKNYKGFIQLREYIETKTFNL